MSNSKSEDTQQDVIDFVTNSETIKKAIEGSMDKRLEVLDSPLGQVTSLDMDKQLREAIE